MKEVNVFICIMFKILEEILKKYNLKIYNVKIGTRKIFVNIQKVDVLNFKIVYIAMDGKNLIIILLIIKLNLVKIKIAHKLIVIFIIMNKKKEL